MTPTSPTANAREHWSRTAIASAILAVMGFLSLGLVIGLFLAAAGAVCGHVARYDTSQEDLRGRRLATLGVAVGYVSMLSFPILLTIVSLSFPAFTMWQSGKNASQREASQARGSRLFLACEAYSRVNRGRYPAAWEDLSGRFIGGKELKDALQSPYEGGAKTAFEIVSHDRPVLDAIADSVIVIQEIAPPEVKEIAVVYADGTVKSIHNPDYQSP
ncbi:MAG: DUF4190 domain-containing protein [Verrucomicrobiales bacterium]|nr:DUF4190 domain-containing protein [Verrucomicrobiales bacterium]